MRMIDFQYPVKLEQLPIWQPNKVQTTYPLNSSVLYITELLLYLLARYLGGDSRKAAGKVGDCDAFFAYSCCKTGKREALSARKAYETRRCNAVSIIKTCNSACCSTAFVSKAHKFTCCSTTSDDRWPWISLLRYCSGYQSMLPRKTRCYPRMRSIWRKRLLCWFNKQGIWIKRQPCCLNKQGIQFGLLHYRINKQRT